MTNTEITMDEKLTALNQLIAGLQASQAELDEAITSTFEDALDDDSTVLEVRSIAQDTMKIIEGLESAIDKLYRKLADGSGPMISLASLDSLSEDEDW